MYFLPKLNIGINHLLSVPVMSVLFIEIKIIEVHELFTRI
jgi:hypothetical protein